MSDIHDCEGNSHAAAPVRLISTPGQRRLVVLNLRGALDGMDAVQPYGDPLLRTLRSTLSVGPQGGAHDLDGFFALHPKLGALMPLWEAGELAFAHAVATPYRDKRSHFDGGDILEAGTASRDRPDLTVRSGWLNRLAATIPGAMEVIPFACSTMTPIIARGDAPFLTWTPATDLGLSPDDVTLMQHIYEPDPQLSAALEQAIAADLLIPPIRSGREDASAIAAHLTNGGGIAVASIGGWDTHGSQADTLAKKLPDVADFVLTIKAGMSPEAWGSTVICVVTEFGRTARQNGSGGTDHGTGSVAMFAGGAVAGGKVYGQWPGLDNLYADRDLLPTSDVRAWLGAVVHAHMGVSRSAVEGIVFPGVTLDGCPL